MLVLSLCFFFVLSCCLFIFPSQFKTLLHKIMHQVPEVCLFISLERDSEVRLMTLIFFPRAIIAYGHKIPALKILLLVLSMQS